MTDIIDTIDYYEYNPRWELLPKEKRIKYSEAQAKKYQKDYEDGLQSKRYNFPEYQWNWEHKGKKYLRSSCNWNVYDSMYTSIVVGTWNDTEKIIEYNDENSVKIRQLEKEVAMLKSKLEELISSK